MALGCEQPAPRATDAVAWRSHAPGLPEAVSATGVDPEAADIGLLKALWELRQRTRCNDVSGCPAADAVRGYGDAAVAPLQALVDKAEARTPWLPRALLLWGEIGGAAALPALLRYAEVEEDGPRSAALLALVRRGAVDAERLRRESALVTAAATARSRLTARWALAHGGDVAAAEAFVALMRELAGQIVAADSLRWGLALCGEREPPSCTPVLAAAAAHPAFLVRREVLRRIEARPRPEHGEALLLLAFDPVSNLRRDASALLAQLTGEQHDDAAGWRQALARWAASAAAGQR